ncbi:alpha/beta fold hydrolase [Pseudomarimonas salicorniae]|uniref:Alpha/beta hydrolase n=1 Tax=Pseudomarimonas salicorniae TaxID=2933270 RepID=A0ABT0GEF2_9GAMM|nr:alpha/beta hydrolase [Lysobacter sp. CAU 1642]MCK7592928.1 alpha/beta hydrolase [Lysobacter sp. CAU 1642]
MARSLFRRLLRAALASSLVVLMLVGGFIVWAWAPDQPVEALIDRWGAPPSRIEAVMGLPVHLRDEGPRDDPQPIVLLHGTGDSLHTWQGWTEALRPTRRVIRYDLPGFGLTGPDPAHDYSMKRQVQVLMAVLERLGVERVVLGGNSYGGGIAWQAALAHPDRVAALVLVDASGAPAADAAAAAASAPRSVPIGFRLARMKWAAPILQRVLPRGVIESSLRNVYGDPSRVTPELVDRYFDLATRSGNRAALQARFGRSGPRASELPVSAITQPTLILWGGRDRLIPPAAGQRFHAAVPNSKLVVFEDLGHVPQEEGAAETVAALQSFLDDLPLSAPAAPDARESG